MITILKEITDWKFTNGIYHVNDHDQLVGYQGPNTPYKEFKEPMKGFNRGRRKFEEVGTYAEAHEETIMKIPFDGSNGKTHYVIVEDGECRCTCPGWKFRSQCKHVDDVIKNGP